MLKSGDWVDWRRPALCELLSQYKGDLSTCLVTDNMIGAPWPFLDHPAVKSEEGCDWLWEDHCWARQVRKSSAATWMVPAKAPHMDTAGVTKRSGNRVHRMTTSTPLLALLHVLFVTAETMTVLRLVKVCLDSVKPWWLYHTVWGK